MRSAGPQLRLHVLKINHTESVHVSCARQHQSDVFELGAKKERGSLFVQVSCVSVDLSFSCLCVATGFVDQDCTSVTCSKVRAPCRLGKELQFSQD